MQLGETPGEKLKCAKFENTPRSKTSLKKGIFYQLPKDYHILN